MRRVISVLFLTAACGDEALDPARPSATSPEPPDAGSEGGAPPVAPRVRDVYMRNPFGGPFDNLMADGDFELSIVPEGQSGQYGWTAFGQSDEATILSETGGLCRSGLRCGRVAGGDVLFGRGTAAADRVPHRASIWLKSLASQPRVDQPCALAEAYVIDCRGTELQQLLEPSEAPDEQGWCQFSGPVDGASVALCMYIQVGSEEVLVDNATLLAAPDLASSPVPPGLPPPPATRERMRQVKERIRSRTPLGDPPLSAPGRAD